VIEQFNFNISLTINGKTIGVATDSSLFENTTFSVEVCYFPHELPFSVVNAGQATSLSIEALYTSIRGTPCKNVPLRVIRI